LIVVPPWPRSGAARVFQNQVDYYRSRGYCTVLLVVPFHRGFMDSSPLWRGVRVGMKELDPDHVFLAPLERNRYNAARYKATIRHAFRGTALDWYVAMAKSARPPGDFMDCVSQRQVAVLHVNYVQNLGFALDLRKRIKNPANHIPLILETHDIQSHLLFERGEHNPWTQKRDPEANLLRSEISMLSKADALTHLSFSDSSFFRAKMPAVPQVLALPTIDEKFVSSVHASAALEESIDLLFVGQNHAPNVAAVKWFFAQVWPLLEKHRYNLKIVGPVDTLVKENLPELYQVFRSHFIGLVDDLPSYYKSARCVIAPMVSGSGTSIKTIEALALGKPFVGTSKAFRGMPIDRIEAAGVHPHDTAGDFAEAVVRAVSTGSLTCAQSRGAYEQIFSVQANFFARDEAFRLAAGKPLVASLQGFPA
jgi:glycosyltransferase involved in cell wall biosynthesis